MKIYNLIHEQDTDAAWGCDVRSFTDKLSAQNAMRRAGRAQSRRGNTTQKSTRMRMSASAVRARRLSVMTATWRVGELRNRSWMCR